MECGERAMAIAAFDAMIDVSINTLGDSDVVADMMRSFAREFVAKFPEPVAAEEASDGDDASAGE